MLEISMQDRDGRSQWSQYTLAPGASSITDGPASGSSAMNKLSTVAASSSTPSASHPFAQPKYPGGGYVPARTPSPVAAVPQPQPQHYQQPQVQPLPHRTSSASVTSSSATPAVAAVVTTITGATTATPVDVAVLSGSAMVESGNIVTRVRALYTFEPTEPGEMAFEKGEVIKVVDRGYQDWWRGQLKGRTGIFPVNYVVRFISLIETSKVFLLTFLTILRKPCLNLQQLS